MGAKDSTVGPTKQLGEFQAYILEWLGNEEERILESKDEDAIQELHEKGIPWSVVNLYSGKPPKNASINASKSVRRLQARGLVSLYDSLEGSGAKPRTSHVALTALGRTLAIYFTLTNKRLPSELTFDTTYMALSLELIETKRLYKLMEGLYSASRPIIFTGSIKGIEVSVSAKHRSFMAHSLNSPEACLLRIAEIESKLETLKTAKQSLSSSLC